MSVENVEAGQTKKEQSTLENIANRISTATEHCRDLTITAGRIADSISGSIPETDSKDSVPECRAGQLGVLQDNMNYLERQIAYLDAELLRIASGLKI